MYEPGNGYTNLQNITIIANVGLPIVEEMFAGNDIDLSSSSTKVFVDENIIENPILSSYYWTMNRYNLSDVRIVSPSGGLNYNNPSSTLGVRPVIYLKSGTSTITFTGGEGTPNSPYVLQ